MNSNIKFVIFTPPYNENIGGRIALYELCRILNSMGIDARIWPEMKISPNKIFCIRGVVGYIWYVIRRILRIDDIRSKYNLKTASYNFIKKAIVVYPEYLSNNPLKSKRVVRWFLNQPGYFSGEINYGINELYFYYQKKFDNPDINKNPDNQLTIVKIIDAYTKCNHGKRKGTCYMVRKGSRREVINYHPEGAVKLDDLSHSEIAKTFNDCEYFISYDLYTMYSVYAVLCGCKSIVVPQVGLSKEEWQPVEKLRYGIAYGYEDLDWADETTPKIIEYYRQLETESLESVACFVGKCRDFFDYDNRYSQKD
jgi:hypothetical protein